MSQIRVPDFAVDIQVGPNDESRVLAILESLPRRYQYGEYSWRNLEELLSDAVEKNLLLSWYGQVVRFTEFSGMKRVRKSTAYKISRMSGYSVLSGSTFG